MDAITTKPEFLVLVLVLVIESIKALILGTATAYHRGRLGKFINSEDANWLGGEVVVSDAPGPSRLFRAHRNALENLLPFSLLALVFIIVGGNSSIGILYFATFSIGRMLHSYAYMASKPMLRRNSYAAALFVQIAMAIHVAVIAIGECINGLL